VDTKVCCHCGDAKPVSEFGKKRSAKDGLQSWCKACKHGNYVENADRWNDRQKQRLAEDPEKERARQREVSRRWYAKAANRQKHGRFYRKDPEAKKAYARAYYQEHREECGARQRAYAERKPEVIRQCSRRRKARARGATGSTSLTQVQQRFALWGNRCWMCGADAQHDDHVKPVGKGGADWPCNHRPACQHCNNVKKDTWPLPSLLGIGFPRPKLPPDLPSAAVRFGVELGEEVAA